MGRGLSPLVLLLAVASGGAAPVGDYIGTSLAGGKLTQQEQLLFEHNVSSAATHAVMTHWWLTAHDDAGDAAYTHFAIFRMYIDGEANASLVFSPSLAIGVGFGDPSAPWATSLFGRGSGAGAWFSNLRIPFEQSIRITLQAAPGAPDYTHLYFICRGAENLGITIAGVEVPLPGSRLVLQTRRAALIPPLAFLTVANLSAGSSGLLLMHTLEFAASNLNTLEGCYHLYTPQRPSFPGIIVASGTEDFFSSSLYFAAPVGKNGGYAPGNIFRSENAGLTHFMQSHDQCAPSFSCSLPVLSCARVGFHYLLQQKANHYANSARTIS
jgi:hypothetical protein